MDLSLPTYLRDALIVLFIASLPSVAWFFRMRKIMLRRQIRVIRALEESLKPRDKRYWVLGYLVGFTARYWIHRGPVAKVDVTYTIPPYHAFFYLPVIILGRKKEKLDIEALGRYKLKSLGKAHLVNTTLRSVKLAVKREIAGSREDYKRGSVRVDGAEYKSYYTSEEALREASSLASELARHGKVHRVTIDTPRKRVAVSITLKSIEDLEQAVGKVLGELEKLSTGERD